jgi:hypothetical protein
MLFSTQVSAGKAADDTKVDRPISSLELGAQKSGKYQQLFPVNSKGI